MALKAGTCGVCSFYSNAFASAAMANPDVDLVAYAHLNQDAELAKLKLPDKFAFGERYGGIKPYATVAAMMDAEQLDIVFVAAHDNMKAEQTVTAADRGAHVFVAKPMCMTLDQADAMVAAAQRNGVFISPLMPGRYDGAIRAMMGKVKNGAIGKVITARAWIQHGCFGPTTIFDGSPEFGPDQGGIDLSLGFYAADMLLWAIDSTPVRAYAEYDNLATPHSIWLDTGKGTVRFDDGRMGSMDIIFNVSCGAPSWEMEVVGTDGIARAHLDVAEGILWHKDSAGAPQVFYRNQNNTIADAIQVFVNAIRNEKPAETTAAHGRNVLELCLAWTRSSKERQAVSLPLA